MSRCRLPWTTLATVGVQARGDDGDRGREPACGAARGRLRRPPSAAGPWRPLPCGRLCSQAPPAACPLPPPPMPCCRLDIAAHFSGGGPSSCGWRPCPLPVAFLRLLRGRRAGDRPLPPRPRPPAARPRAPIGRPRPRPCHADAWGRPRRQLMGASAAAPGTPRIASMDRAIVNAVRRASAAAPGTPRIAPSAPCGGGIRPPIGRPRPNFYILTVCSRRQWSG